MTTNPSTSMPAPHDTPRQGPLSRYRVLDLTRVRSGPTAVRQLADWGAEVIKIETPAALEGQGAMGGPREKGDFQNLHRNKRSMTLNLKHEQGAAIFKKLVSTADVVIENYRPDVKHRLGIDYDSLKSVNPRLVYGSISGFGQDGPYQNRAGFDQIAQGMGGLMSITGLPGQGPVRAGIPVADLSAGLFCAMGVLVALLEREVSGEGQWVQTSLLQAQAFMLDFQGARWLVDKHVPRQAGNDHPTSIPTGVFPTTDGYLNIAAAGQAIWERLIEALDVKALQADPRYADTASRSEHRKSLNEVLAERTKTYGSEALIELLNNAGVPCGPIYDIDQMFADPQVKHLNIAQQVPSSTGNDVSLLAQPFTLSRTPSELRHAVPNRGTDTDAILKKLGLSASEIAALRDQGAL